MSRKIITISSLIASAYGMEGVDPSNMETETNVAPQQDSEDVPDDVVATESDSVPETPAAETDAASPMGSEESADMPDMGDMDMSGMDGMPDLSSMMGGMGGGDGGMPDLSSMMGGMGGGDDGGMGGMDMESLMKMMGGMGGMGGDMGGMGGMGGGPPPPKPELTFDQVVDRLKGSDSFRARQEFKGIDLDELLDKHLTGSEKEWLVDEMNVIEEDGLSFGRNEQIAFAKKLKKIHAKKVKKGKISAKKASESESGKAEL